MSIYGLLDADAREWWYHAKLREEGRIDEARKRERQSIRSAALQLRGLRDSHGTITWSESAGCYYTSEYPSRWGRGEGQVSMCSSTLGGYRTGWRQVEAARRLGITVVGRDPLEPSVAA